MVDNVVTFPKWKKGATAAEVFTEFARLAKLNPDHFEDYIVIWESSQEADIPLKIVSAPTMTICEVLGFLAIAQNNTLRELD